MTHQRPRSINSLNTSVESLNLIKRMAKQNMDFCDAPPTEEEKRKYKEATELILLFYAVLNNAIMDVEAEFSDAGLFRHQTKKAIKTAQDILFRNYDILYRKLVKVDRQTGLAYDHWMIKSCNAVDDCILLTPPERSFNIAIALCRILVRYNNNLGRFIIAEAYPLERVLKILSQIKVVEDHFVDNIIELTLKRLNNNDERIYH